MSSSDIKYRVLHIFAENDEGEKCDSVVDVFLRTGKNADLISQVEISERQAEWPTDGVCLRVNVSNGPVKLVDNYKDYSLEFFGKIEDGKFKTMKCRIKPAGSGRAFTPISVRRFDQASTGRRVMMSAQVYRGQLETTDLPDGLTLAPRERRLPGRRKEPENVKKEKERQVTPPRSRASSSSRKSEVPDDDGVFVVDCGISKLNTKLKAIPAVRKAANERKILMARNQNDIDALGNVSCEETVSVKLKNSLSITSFVQDDEGKYQFQEKQDAIRLKLDLVGNADSLFIVVRIDPQ
uniref:Uncharacterized protein n=1 Tax=viral metagenome TaxID=1070528 RepID=A0A2V0RKE8_9ZZZZ